MTTNDIADQAALDQAWASMLPLLPEVARLTIETPQNHMDWKLVTNCVRLVFCQLTQHKADAARLEGK